VNKLGERKRFGSCITLADRLQTTTTLSITYTTLTCHTRQQQNITVL